MLGMTTGWCRVGVAGVERRKTGVGRGGEVGVGEGCRTRSCRALRG